MRASTDIITALGLMTKVTGMIDSSKGLSDEEFVQLGEVYQRLLHVLKNKAYQDHVPIARFEQVSAPALLLSHLVRVSGEMLLFMLPAKKRN